MFAIMPQSVRRGFVGLSRPKNSGRGGGGGGGGGGGYDGHHNNALPTTTNNSSSSIIGRPYAMLALNLLSQLICVAGVNQLSSVRPLFYFIFSLFNCLLNCFKLYKTTEIYTTDLLVHFTHFFTHTPFTFPIRQNGLVTHFDYFFLFFILLPIESIRGVNTSRTHYAQGNKLVFQRVVVRQWLERAARSGGSYGVCRIILVFISAGAGTSGAKRQTGKDRLISHAFGYQFYSLLPP